MASVSTKATEKIANPATVAGNENPAKPSLCDGILSANPEATRPTTIHAAPNLNR